MVDDEIEKEIAAALKPLEAHQGRQRPFMSMVDTPTPEPVNTVPEPPQAQEEPILTLTERLQQLQEGHGRIQGRLDLMRDDMAAMEARLQALLMQLMSTLG